MSEGVLFEVLPDHIAVITFNRPQSRNALDLAAMWRFASVVNEVAGRCQPESEAPLRAVILTGAGRDAFCSGGDLLDLRERPTEDDAREFTGIMRGALARLEQLPVPVIAAVNGYALGGGSEIATACDLRFVDEAAQMGFIHIRMALIPGWGAGQRLLRIVGYSRALAILLDGRPMGADELLRGGLVHQIAERGQAYEAALAYAQKIVQHPPAVVSAMKQMLWAGLTLPYDQALDAEHALFPPLWAAEPHLNAVEAFFNRR